MNEENTNPSEQQLPPEPTLSEPTPPEPIDRGHESKEMRIARICHEVNRTYCSSIDDDSQVSWDEVPTEQKELMLEGVRFHANHQNASASAGHERWLEIKGQEGWKYGKVKNEESKEHPFYVPFVDLPKEQKAKGFIFKAIVNSLS